jgi:processive rubber oxygenase RoxA-like protein
MEANLSIAKPICRWLCWAVAVAAGLSLLAAIYLAYRLNIDEAERFDDDPAMQFKYGSTGGDKNFGIPYAIWQVLPDMFPEYMPKGRENEGWAAFGFIYDESDKEKLAHYRPVGTSFRNYMGVDRIFLNCAVCHAGTLRMAANEKKPQVYLGMPANRIDLQAFQDFIINVTFDERFTPEYILAEIDKRTVDDPQIELDWLNRLAFRWFGIYQVRERTLLIADRFKFAHREPAFGPGRFDTFSPAKALFNWQLKDIPDKEAVGMVDFPSIWLQEQRRGMQLHWDGNNTKLEERNRSAAFGTGALPPILDRASIKRIEDWLLKLEPPTFAGTFPDQIDRSLLDQGQKLYEKECANCHGRNGRDFDAECTKKDDVPECVGRVTPLYKIATDRHRFDNYTQDLALNQNMLYAEYGDERFQNFRKTDGYANMPLDGLWLRAPYLHNGSVPTLWDLLKPPSDRPPVFYRGYDLYDPVDVGFESRWEKIPDEERKHVFCFQTRPEATCGVVRQPQEDVKPLDKPWSYDTTPAHNKGTCTAGICPGNGNGGHDYGTTLADPDKRALIEYLKTF